ncbi:Ferritin-like [Pedobacter steynii]|uniref:Ferritin-like n=1 Tax=Pedobacter steynii TaxID=430522 RepID=A0A1G9R6B8_9SPHI|nr:ferritin-like protein [Pedobacter steynii]NQX37885.1 ferritin-like protein [Pedobacter steynii]SDM17975.1 Ferritin-like [Pedobacter steynii]
MLKISPEYINQVKQATVPEDLFGPLQSALMLEHSTIPPYLTAMFSLKPGKNLYIREVIHSIVIEEMLHLTIVANILNALGGSPVLNNKNFIPQYPGPLPMGIGDQLVVGLTKYSTDQVKNVFMEIEEPEIPLVIPEMKSFKAAKVDYHTIGEFYKEIQAKIAELAISTMPGDPKKQVVSAFFKADQLFPITNTQDAQKAIDIIVEQGEGTDKSPAFDLDEIAHYYKFEELYKGRKIVADSDSPLGYSFSQEPIPFDADEVFNFFPNTKSDMIPPEHEGYRLINQFNFSYATLLNGLNRTFNGEPDFLPHTIGIMYDLKLLAEKLGSMNFPGKKGYTIGPSFEYVEVNL